MKTTGTIDDGTGLWISPNLADNSSEFSALPGGARYFQGQFSALGEFGYWWGKNSPSSPSVRGISHDYANIGTTSFSENAGHYIRCIKN